MENVNLKQLKKYFSNFCSKNIEEIKDIFSDDIELKDWNNKFFGKKEVLKEVESIFNSFTSIRLDVCSIYNSTDTINCEDSGNKFACQIEITFDDGKPLSIIDLIEFDDTGKIKSILAYKQ